MVTSLGHGIANAIIFHGQNDHASTTILKGEVIKLDITVIAYADGMTKDAVFAIQPNDTIDSSIGVGGIALGIAREDIIAGATGEFVVFGLVQCLGDDTAAVGAVIGVDASDAGRTSDAANATFQAPCGIQLETGVQGERKWCFVDFISGSFGGQSNLTLSGPTTFWGTAY